MQPSEAALHTMVWLRAAIGLVIAGGALFLTDAAVFRSGAYSQIADPDAAAGHFDLKVRVERARQRDGRKQILIIGDSRARSIRPRFAEELSSQWNLAFANAVLFGSTPRAWYYLLREVDPDARRYDAVVIALDDFDDNNDYSKGETTDDVEMPASALRLRDLFDYPWTFHDPVNRRDAILECLLRGSPYKRDFQELLSDPAARAKNTSATLQEHEQYFWNDEVAGGSLAGLEVDWVARKLKFPASTDWKTREVLRMRVENLPSPDDGMKAALRREWLGRIARHYRSSRALLVFARVPSTPLPYPLDRRPVPLRGTVRDLAAHQANILLLDEHLFDAVERPEYFYDFTHPNKAGSTLTTKIFVGQVPLILAHMAGRT